MFETLDSYSIRIDMKATGEKIKELRIKNNLLVLSCIFDTPMDEIIQRERRGDEPLLPISIDFSKKYFQIKFEGN